MNEVNRLYSEYYNNLPIRVISQLHSRSEEAILYKLSDEGVIQTDWSDVKGWSYDQPDAEYQDQHEEDDQSEGQDEDEEDDQSEYQDQNEGQDEDEDEEEDQSEGQDEDEEDDQNEGQDEEDDQSEGQDEDEEDQSEGQDEDEEDQSEGEDEEEDQNEGQEEPSTSTADENELYDPYSIPQKISFIEWLLRAFLLYFFGKN